MAARPHSNFETKPDCIMRTLALALCLFHCITRCSGQCDAQADSCAALIGKNYIIDPNFFHAVADSGDIASCKAVWLGGQTYRLAVRHSANQAVAWRVYDEAGQLLFDNGQFENAQIWDFLAENTMEVLLVLQALGPNQKNTCLTLVTGFKK